ncbi:MAG: ATP-binding cassette domain-containing protein [Anaerolineales bacterium]|nr:ATP-binding cassette domain-containing protein [Anaerolineales bacterium]
MTKTIRLENLERRFQRGEMSVQALKNINLTVEEGEFVALVGPSGSGKSTLLNLLGGLDHPSAGELWLDAIPLHTAGEKERTTHRRDRVGFIFQSFNLLPRLTALENVAVPLMLAGVEREEREKRAVELLQLVGLSNRLDHYPTELSGGEQQRTAVARALVHQPVLILADEPTGNLDSKTGAEVMNLLRRLNGTQGITLIVVTHDSEVAAYADRIVHLRDGEIVKIEANKIETAVPESVNFSPAPLTTHNGLRWTDIVRSAAQNLGRRPVRNILTAGGVLIGIVTLVAMVSFGVGVQREVQRNFETIGLENIFASPLYEEGDGFDPFAALEPATPITPAVVEAIRELPGVAAASPELSLPRGMEMRLRRSDQTIPVRLTEGGESRFSFGNVNQIIAGEDIAEGDSSGTVLWAGLADKILAPDETYADLIGTTVQINLQLPRGETEDFPTTIIGVRDSFGSRTLNLGLDERIRMKTWWFGQPNLLEDEGYDMVTVRADDLTAVADVITGLEELNLRTQSLDTILDVVNQVLSLMQALLGSVGALALLVAALGVANTMMMAIYERTREIGVLKALGASRGEIRSLFTMEAAFIGLLGGFFGLLAGALLGRIVDWIAHRYLISEGVTGVGVLSIVPPWLAIGALVFAALIGILAGLYPAARAARLDPVTALRHE